MTHELRTAKGLVLLICVLLGATCGGAAPPNDRDALLREAEQFLAAYADGDGTRVLSFVTAGTPHIYGSDTKEVVNSREQLIDLLRADHRLWRGKVAFGPLQHASEERSGSLATLFFDTDFSIGGKVIPLRFSTVWRRERGRWRLVQSSNAQPTTGQSAAKLLGSSR